MRKRNLIGCDPEFLILSENDEVLYAGDYLDFGDEVGTDGAGTPMELRPEPQASPEKLIEELKHLFKKAYRKLEGKEFTPYCLQNTPIGFHIHFDTFDFMDWNKYEIVTKYLYRLVTFTNLKNQQIRNQAGYGDYARFRLDHTYEFRIPPSLISMDPELLLLYLKLIHELYYKVLIPSFEKEEPKEKIYKKAKDFYQRYYYERNLIKKRLEELDKYPYLYISQLWFNYYTIYTYPQDSRKVKLLKALTEKIEKRIQNIPLTFKKKILRIRLYTIHNQKPVYTENFRMKDIPFAYRKHSEPHAFGIHYSLLTPKNLEKIANAIFKELIYRSTNRSLFQTERYPQFIVFSPKHTPIAQAI